MNESINNILFARGKVSQDGYPDCECTFVKPVENRHDETKDKPLYVVLESELESPLFVVTPNVLEALGRVERKTLGVMTITGDIVVPMIHSDIKKFAGDYLACNKSNSSTELEIRKSDPIKAQDNASLAADIKKRITDLAKDSEFVCSGFYDKLDIYKVNIDGKKVTCDKVCSEMSFVAIAHDGGIYAHSNNLLDSVVTIKEGLKKEVEVTKEVKETTHLEMKEPDFLRKMPDNFTRIKPKPLDSLVRDSDVPEVRADAPKLIEENKEDLGKMPEEPVMERKSIFSDDIVRPKARLFRLESRNDANLDVVPQLVDAVKDKLNSAKDEIAERDDTIDKLEKRVDLLNQKVEAQKKQITSYENQNNDLFSENKNLRAENDELTKTNEGLVDENQKLRDTIDQVVTEFSGFIDSGSYDNDRRYGRVA